MPRSAPARDPLLADFDLVESARARVLVRRGYEALARWLESGAPPAGAERVEGGRVPHPLVALESGERVVLRAYRRGGALRHLNRERYFAGDRALEELRATERARRAGVRVPRVVGAARRRLPLGYTATLATVWIPGALELHRWLGEAPPERHPAALEEAGRQVAAMHGAGIGHPDLNLRNLLVAGEGEVYLIDFDRARLYPAPVPPARRARDLLRLARSARKLASPIGPAGWEALRRGYGSAWPLREPLG